MLPPSFGEGGGMSYNFYSLAEKKVISLKKKSEPGCESPDDDALVVGSSHGWLALYNQRGDGGLFLSNPITGENIKLPNINDGDASLLERKEEECFVRKVILTFAPSRYNGIYDCTAVAIFGGGHLGVCCPSSKWSDTIGWEKLDFDLVDVVYSMGTNYLYSILEYNECEYENGDEICDLVVWSASNPWNLEEEWRMELHDARHFDRDKENYPFFARSDEERALKQLCKRRRTRHLVYVPHTGELLLVKRHLVQHMAPDGSPIIHSDHHNHNNMYPHKTIGFDVHVIDTVYPCKLRYKQDSLDGLVLFVGLNHSFAVQAADFPELKPDSIYFTECEPLVPPSLCPHHTYGGHDIGIFDYKNKTISSCYYPSDHGSLRKIYPSPVWFTPSRSPY